MVRLWDLVVEEELKLVKLKQELQNQTSSQLRGPVKEGPENLILSPLREVTVEGPGKQILSQLQELLVE